MRCGIPLLGDRVAPRYRCADGILIVVVARDRVCSRRWLPLEITDPTDLISVLKRHRIDMVVCGGISREERETLTLYARTVVENVACSAREVVSALEEGVLCSGFGFARDHQTIAPPAGSRASVPAKAGPKQAPTGRPSESVQTAIAGFNCLSCREKTCLLGERCVPPALESTVTFSAPVLKMLEAATDVASEEERQLCRLAELVYFCLEMDYRKIGIAFCVDLQEPAEILAGVLDRSFETVGVCCKIARGRQGSSKPRAEKVTREPTIPPIACNPVAQAQLLNQAATDLNVIVGLCTGSDCVFTQESHAPVTTLFVKDKSLANNPIGAVYSEYYLRESETTLAPAREPSERPAWRNKAIVHRGGPEGLPGREDRS